MPARNCSIRLALVGTCAAVILAGLAPAAVYAQPTVPPRQAVRHPDPIPQRETLIRLSRPITVEFRDQRLGDVIAFIRDYSQADIEPLWVEDRNPVGLDPERTVTINARNITVLRFLERILELSEDDFAQYAWQMSDTGAFQMGPKERLNRWKRTEIYDINDLLMEIPDFPDVPRIDLNQALQAAGGGGGGGGGGGQSPFTGDTEDRREREQNRQQRAEEVANLIRDIVETDQWTEMGGSGGSMRIFRGTLIVTAPDYMHRGINGYPYWPSTATTARIIEGRRYVSLTTDNSISTLAGMAVQPVTAVAPGGQPSGPPGGGG
jgi:hypothetical protein